MGLDPQPRSALLAAYTLIGLLSDIDLELPRALRDASWWWLAFALVLAQLPRIPAAVSTMGSIEQPLPLGPLTALQFAICYVNLAIPSTAARVAINMRFFQRFGVGPTTAMSAGVIDSVSGFVVQIVLFVALFFLSDARPRSDHRHVRATAAGPRSPSSSSARSSCCGVVVMPCRPCAGVWLRPSGEAQRRAAGACGRRPSCCSCSAATC